MFLEGQAATQLKENHLIAHIKSRRYRDRQVYFEYGTNICVGRVFPACRSNPCQNDGACRLIVSTGQEVCYCRRGYSGPYCSVGE